jgi:hypothetical protein
MRSKLPLIIMFFLILDLPGRMHQFCITITLKKLYTV